MATFIHRLNNVSITFNNVQYYCANNLKFWLGGLFNFLIINSSFHGSKSGFPITFHEYPKSYSAYPGTQLTSTLVLENSQIYNNKQGLKIVSDVYLLKEVNYHIIIKSCLIYDNINEGLFIDETFLRQTQIDIINTELIGNGGNKIMNSDGISLSNVTVANSTSTGLSLITAFVTINNTLIFKNNTGVVGGGLAINDSSRLIVSSSANLEFIDNHASYKGGGIYAEQATYTDVKLMTSDIPLTLTNNSAGLVGGDLYGNFIDPNSYYTFKFTHTSIDSTSDADFMFLSSSYYN